MKQTVIFFIFLYNLHFAYSQTNKLTTNKNGREVLLGEISKTDLTKNTFNTWFSKNYNNYLANTSIVKKLKKQLPQYNITVFLGTWCGDSKQEIPRFYNILELAEFPKKQLTVIALNNNKQSPSGKEKGLNIHRVPTFIFYKNGKEVNRIVEHPRETLKRDILNILTENKYTPNYNVVHYLNHILDTKPLDRLVLKTSVLVPRLSEYVKGSRELNTYGYSLLRSNQNKKAKFVFLLNTKIFPYNYNVFDNLGEAYFESKSYTLALKNYYKVLSLKPDDKNASNMIEKIKHILN